MTNVLYFSSGSLDSINAALAGYHISSKRFRSIAILSGLGDDDANLEDDFITWKEKFWTSACEKLKLEIVGDDFSTRQYEIKARLPYSSLSQNDLLMESKPFLKLYLQNLRVLFAVGTHSLHNDELGYWVHPLKGHPSLIWFPRWGKRDAIVNGFCPLAIGTKIESKCNVMLWVFFVVGKCLISGSLVLIVSVAQVIWHT